MKVMSMESAGKVWIWSEQSIYLHIFMTLLWNVKTDPDTLIGKNKLYDKRIY